MDDPIVRDISITRSLSSDRERVWQMWTEPAALRVWFAPHGFEVDACDVDPRPGGVFTTVLRGPDGTEFSSEGSFLELRPPERLVFTSAVGGADTTPSFEATNTVTFADHGDSTEITVHVEVVRAAAGARAALAGMYEGWTECLERLESSLTGTPVDVTPRSIRGTRDLDVPRSSVWEAWTSPEHIAQWWGPTGYRTTIELMDVRPGGMWLHTMRGPDGQVFDNRVVFLEVDPPERLVFVHGGPGSPDHFLSVVTFSEEAERTVVSIESLFPTEADRRRAADEYGAAEGLRQTLSNLEEYLGRPGIIKMRHDAM